MKDYSEIVKADWEQVVDQLLNEITESLISNGIYKEYVPTQEELEKREQLEQIHDEYIKTEYGGTPIEEPEFNSLFDYVKWIASQTLYNTEPFYIDGDLVKKILVSFPQDTNNQIRDILAEKGMFTIFGDNAAHEYYGTNGTHPQIGLIELAIERRKALNDTIKKLAPAVKSLKPDCPDIVSQPLVSSLNTAVEYVRFLDGEIATSMYKPDGKKRHTTKHDPRWKTIYTKIVDILSDAINQHNCSSESPISLAARLLDEAYPWYWGKYSHIDIEKTIRAGCNRRS